MGLPGGLSSGADAARCLEKLWDYIELHLRNRVAAKTGGRAISPELTGLQCHSAKPRTLAPPAGTSRHPEAGVVATPEQRKALRAIFIFYCSWAEKSNYMYMSRSQFLRCCRDAQLMDGDLDAVALTLLFDKVQLESSGTARGGRISMQDWLQAMQLVALQLYPNHMPQQAWEAVVQEHLLQHGAKADACRADPLAEVMLDSAVVQALYKAKHRLLPIFQHYVQQQCISAPQQRQRRPVPSVAAALSILTRPMSPRGAAPTGGSWHAAHVPTGSGPSMHMPGTSRHASHMLLSSAHSAHMLPVVPVRASSVSQRRSSGCGLLLDPACCAAPSNIWQHAPDGVLRTSSKASLAGAATMGAPATSPPLASATAAARVRSAAVVQQARTQMPLVTFLRFLLDFDVIPKLLNQAQASACFRAARMGARCEQDVEGASTDALDRVTFIEFLDAVGRCALVAFDFKLPRAPEALMDFSSSYEQGAKLLWTTTAARELASSLVSPDEVELPHAMHDECIGNEDAAHFDDRNDALSTWGARSARSRTGGIFRTARSLAQYKIKRVAGKGGHEAGAEVMVLHDMDSPPERDPMDNRPLHLKPFSPDWIGRPSPPLSETTQLQRRFPDTALSLGIYNGTDAGLPPVFAQRAADMVEARTAREQVLEGLRLLFVAERRAERRQRHATAKQQRQMLQQAGGQRLVERPVTVPVAATTHLTSTSPLWDVPGLQELVAS